MRPAGGILVVAVLFMAMLVTVPSPAGATLSPSFATQLTEPSSNTDFTEVRFLPEAVFTGGAKAAAAVMVADTNNDDTIQTTEGWYIDMDGTGTVTIGDVRLTNAVSAYQASSRVLSAHTDVGEDLDAGGSLCYTDEHTAIRGTSSYNVQPQGSFTPSTLYNEPAYIDISSTSCGSTVAENDVRLVASNSHSGSGGSAGARVASSAGDIGNSTVAFPSGARFRAYDLDNSGSWTLNDALYWDVDNSGTPTQGDIRIIGFGSHQSGTPVRTGDTDTAGVIEALTGGSAQFVYVDKNTDSVFTCSTSSTTETLYLDHDSSGTINADDYRINAVTGAASFSAGTIVKAGDGDVTSSNVNTIGARIKYYDGNNDASFGIGDTLYLDSDNGATVNAGDLRIGSTDSGLSDVTCITTSSSDRNRAITTTGLTLTVRWHDQDGSDTHSRGDLPYLDSDADGEISLGDMRLSSVYTTFGSVGDFVLDTSTDWYHSFPTNAAAGIDPSLRYMDANGNNAFGANDPVYIAMSSTSSVRAADVRLSTGSGSCAAGTQVLSSDTCATDFGDPTTALGSAVLRYVEEGTYSAAYDTDDHIYLDTDASGTVTVGDVRFASRGSGSVGSFVLNGNSDLSDSLNDFTDGAFAASQIRIIKAIPTTTTGYSSTYSVGDVVFYDVDNDGYPTLGDLILSGSGGATSSSSSSSGGSGSTTPTQTQSTTAPQASFTLQDVNEDTLTLTVNGQQSTAVSGRTITTYAWNWGDGETDSGTQAQRSHTYASTGMYTVTLTVTDSSGETDSHSRNVEVGVADTETETDTGTETDTDTGTETETETDTGTDTDTETETGTEPPEGTPGAGAVLLVVSILGLLAVTRRRRA